MPATKKYNMLSQRILNLIKDIDFIGPQFSLQNSDSPRFQSLQGSCWSILTITIMLVGGFMFGKEIYERRIPNVSSNRENINDPSIYFSEFPLMFTLITPDGRILGNSELRGYLEPFIMRIVYDSNGALIIDQKINDFESCQSSRFNKFQDLVSNELNSVKDERYLCLKFSTDDYFANTIFALNSTNYNIGFRKCKAECASDIEEVVNHILLDVVYINSFVDVNNYNNPVSIYLEHLTTQLEVNLFRRSYMRFVYNNLYSDYGWLAENKVLDIIPYLESLVPDDMGYLTMGDYKDGLFLLSVESPKSIMVFTRSYMKVQELLANIGGLANAIIVAIRLASDAHLKFILYFFIKSCAIDTIGKQILEMKPQKNIEVQPPEKTESFKRSKQIAQAKNEEGTTIKIKACNLNSSNRQLKPENIQYIGIIKEELNEKSCSASVNDNPILQNNVQTVIHRNNELSRDHANHLNHKSEVSMKDQTSEGRVTQLRMMRSKMSFYSPSVKSNIKSVSETESFLDYALSIMCCKKERVNYYLQQMRSIRKIISIHTYTNLVLLNSNEEEHVAFENLKDS